jgi:hypothetical protein
MIRPSSVRKQLYRVGSSRTRWDQRPHGGA